MIATWLCTGALAAGLLASPAVSQADHLLDAWQLEDALAMAETLLAQSPNDGATALLAAEVLHQRGAHVQALAVLRHLGPDAPQVREVVITPLIEASAAYAAVFGSIETRHFSIRYINKDEIVAHYAVPVLEAAYANIGADLGFLPAERGEKIVVEIYPDARGLAGATGLTIKEIETSGTIAVCKFHRLMITSPLATADGYDWADTLAHEFTHLIISKRSKNNIPIWLHEGIAKYFESRWKGPAGRNLSPYGEKLLAQAVRNNKFITFEQMHPSMAKLPSQDDAALAFAEVFSVIEFVVEQHGTGAVANILRWVGEGTPLEQAVHKAVGMDLGTLEQAWKKALKKRPLREYPDAKPAPIRLATNQDDSKKERPLEAMREKQVHDAARLGELLQLRSQPKAAIVEYQKAMDHGGAHYITLVNRLARAYLEVGREDEALKLIERGLKEAPTDTDAQLLAGRMCLKKQDFSGARRHFEAVRMQNPFNPEVHAALAALYKHAGDDAGAQAEQRFLLASEQPRPTRSYETPVAPAGEAALTIITVPWGKATLDGNALTVATPAWEVPVAAGAHKVAFLRPDGKMHAEDVQVAPGGRGMVVLR